MLLRQLWPNLSFRSVIRVLIISVVAWIFAEIVAMFSIVLNDGEETEIDCANSTTG
jgi:hypothetical protein